MESVMVSADTDKHIVIEQVRAEVQKLGLRIIDEDVDKPWGAYFVIDPEQIKEFIDIYFADYEFEEQDMEMDMQPKYLIVAPNSRLSWQYHHRRKELWKVAKGPVKVMMSENDDQTNPLSYDTGEIVVLPFGIRHRLIGAENWGVVAEIWQHTDSEQPSTEEDIVRVQDDFGR